MFCPRWFIVLASLVFSIPGLPSRSYTIQEGDTLWALFQNIEKADFVARLNGLEPSQLQPKRVIEIPTDWSLCRSYAPLPKVLPEQTKVPQLTLVDLKTQFLGTYEHGRLTWWCRISPGRDEKPTATGTYHVEWKDIDHASNLYLDDRGNGRPMHYGVNIGGEFWIHEGYLPGYPASHGCIRLRHTDATHYFAWVQVGATAIVR